MFENRKENWSNLIGMVRRFVPEKNYINQKIKILCQDFCLPDNLTKRYHWEKRLIKRSAKVNYE